MKTSFLLQDLRNQNFYRGQILRVREEIGISPESILSRDFVASVPRLNGGSLPRLLEVLGHDSVYRSLAAGLARAFNDVSPAGGDEDAILSARVSGSRELFWQLVALLEALDEMGAREAPEAAISLVRHRAGQVRAAAFGVLGNRRHFEAKDEMLRGLDDADNDVRAAALISLQRTVPQAQGSWDSVTELVKWLDSSSAQRRQYSLWRLAIVEDPNTVEAITKVLLGEDGNIASHAALALAGIRGEDATKALLDALKSAGNTQVWVAAGGRERRAVPLLLDRISKGGLGSQSALFPLAEIGGPGVLEGAKHACRGRSLELFNPALYWGIKAKLGDKESWQKLLACAKNVKSHKDRITAAGWLTYANKASAIDPLVDLLADEDDEVRQAAAAAMTVIAELPPRAREALKKALDDSQAPVRSAAATALRNWRIKRTDNATNSAWSAPDMLRDFTSESQQSADGTPR